MTTTSSREKDQGDSNTMNIDVDTDQDPDDAGNEDGDEIVFFHQPFDDSDDDDEETVAIDNRGAADLDGMGTEDEERTVSEATTTERSSSAKRFRTTSSSRSLGVLVSVDSSVLRLSSANDNDDNDEESEHERKSHMCCLSCCDLVRACIIVDVVDICLTSIVMLLSCLGYDESFVQALDFAVFDAIRDSDAAAFQDNDRIEGAVPSVVLVMTSCGIFFSAMGILGASRFLPYPVLCSAIWNCVYLIWAISDGRYLGSVVTGFFAYPHFALFGALHNGQITRNNFRKTEEYCCCWTSGAERKTTVPVR
jgi:uncharacterized membrane protein YqhA